MSVSSVAALQCFESKVTIKAAAFKNPKAILSRGARHLPSHLSLTIQLISYKATHNGQSLLYG